MWALKEPAHTSVHACRTWWRSKHTQSRAATATARKLRLVVQQQQWLLSAVGSCLWALNPVWLLWGWSFWRPDTLRADGIVAAAKSLQSCPTLCDPIDGSPPGSPVPGILQARTLEWVAISFSNSGKWKVKGKSLSSVWLLATPWTAPHQAPPSKGFSRQEYWSGVPLPSLTASWTFLQL